jgi:hypothetical protein
MSARKGSVYLAKRVSGINTEARQNCKRRKSSCVRASGCQEWPFLEFTHTCSKAFLEREELKIRAVLQLGSDRSLLRVSTASHYTNELRANTFA